MLPLVAPIASLIRVTFGRVAFSCSNLNVFGWGSNEKIRALGAKLCMNSVYIPLFAPTSKSTPVPSGFRRRFRKFSSPTDRPWPPLKLMAMPLHRKAKS